MSMGIFVILLPAVGESHACPCPAALEVHATLCRSPIEFDFSVFVFKLKIVTPLTQLPHLRSNADVLRVERHATGTQHLWVFGNKKRKALDSCCSAIRGGD